MKAIFILSLTFILVMSMIKDSYGVGEPVFDEAAVLKIGEQIEQAQKGVDVMKEMSNNIGDGKLTPDTVLFMGKWYTKCGGSRFALPDWFPSLNIKICGSQVSIFNSVADDYKKNYIPLSGDDAATISKKENTYMEAGKKVKVFALTRSSLTLRSVDENQKVLDSLQTSLNSAVTQTQILKVQTQATIQLVQQMQELNQQLATLTQVEGFK